MIQPWELRMIVHHTLSPGLLLYHNYQQVQPKNQNQTEFKIKMEQIHHCPLVVQRDEPRPAGSAQKRPLVGEGKKHFNFLARDALSNIFDLTEL